MKASEYKKAINETLLGRTMEELSDQSIETVSEMTELEGSGNEFSTPIFYRALMRIAPPVVRSLTNVTYNGIERVPSEGAAIIAGNHVSHIDPIIKIMGVRRPVHYLAKAEHFEDKKFQRLMKSTGQIQTFRETGGADALSTAVDVLDSGGVMGIFPEGTRSRNTQPPYLGEGKTGVARLAARYPKVPVVPMAIIGSRDFIAPGSRSVNPLAQIEVNIGKPITFSEWLVDPDGGKLDNQGVKNISTLDEDDRKKAMKSLYRDFTNQLIETLRILGAP
tara:strand:- start:3541 stop:4371 length:831 start_codon:yes stop_codon:yes gene_type:complete